MPVSPAVLPAILIALTAAQWQTEITFLQSELPQRHPNLFFQLPQAEWNAALDDLKAHADGYSDVEMLIRIQQVVARVGDGHTEVDTRRQPQTFFPLKVYRFTDGIFVTKTTDASRAACGARVVAVDGMDAEDVYTRAGSLISHENEAWVAARFGTPMTRAESLFTLGVTGSIDGARFTFEKGSARFHLDLAPISSSEAGVSVLAPYAADESWPLYLRNPKQYYWYVFDPDLHLMYVKYNFCSNDPSRPFDAFAREIFAIADRERVDRFVVDVRNNGGGNSSVAQPLIDGLAQRAQLRGRLYVIVGRETFSSGMLNAIELKARAGAIIAGEPSGGKPNSYGELKSFALPASNAVVYHSTKFFRNVTGDPESIIPDIPVSLSSSDFFARRDPVLDAITGVKTVSSRRRTVTFGRSCQ